jgi:hypothetical protein
VHTNETTQMDESLIGNKIITPLKESVSEVEKLVRAGVYKELYYIYIYHGSCIIENPFVIIVYRLLCVEHFIVRQKHLVLIFVVETFL